LEEHAQPAAVMPPKKGKKPKAKVAPLNPLVKRHIIARVYSDQLQEELRSLEEEHTLLNQRLVQQKGEFKASQISLQKNIHETQSTFQGAAVELESCYGDTQSMQEIFRDELEKKESILKGQHEQLVEKNRNWKQAKGPLDRVRGKNENMKDHLENLRGQLVVLLSRLNSMDTSISVEQQRNAIEFADAQESVLEPPAAPESRTRSPTLSRSASSKSVKLPAYQKLKVLGDSKKVVTFTNKAKGSNELSQSNSMPSLSTRRGTNAIEEVTPNRTLRRKNSLLPRNSTVPVNVVMAANQGDQADIDDEDDQDAPSPNEDDQIQLMVCGKKVYPPKELSKRSYACEVPSLVILLLRIISKSKNLAKIQSVVNMFRTASNSDAESVENDPDSEATLGGGGQPTKKSRPHLVNQRSEKNVMLNVEKNRRWKQTDESTLDTEPTKISPRRVLPKAAPNVPKVIEDLLSAIECMMLATVEERTASAMNKIQGVQVILDTMDRFESPGVHAQATKLLWKILMHSPSKSKTLLAKNGIHHLSKSLQMYCFVPAVHITAVECLNAILPSEFIEATQRHGGEDAYAELMKQNVSNRRNAVVVDSGFGGGKGAPKELVKKGLDFKKMQGNKSFQVLHKEGSEPLVQILRYKTDRMKASALRRIDRALLEHSISHAEISSLNMGKAIRVMFATLLFCVQHATTTKRKGDKGWAAVQEVFVLRSKSIAHLCEALYILMLKDEHSYVDELMSHPKQLGILLRILNDFFKARNVVVACCRLFCVMLSNKKLSREDMVHAGLPASVKEGVAAHGPDAELHTVSAPILEYFGDKARRLQEVREHGVRNPASPSPPQNTRALRRSAVGIVPITGLLPSVV
jgi:hypothetical protein